MSFDFQTTAHGKWILAGEHAVVRGHSALVFPMLEKTLTLSYRKSASAHLELHVHVLGQDPDKMQTLLKKLIEYGAPLIGQSYANLQGHLHIESNIPVGVGMGASAALCVALARWFTAQRWINAAEIYAVARELEHFFHGKSSGLDIAGVASDIGVCFQNGTTTNIQSTWSPHWQFSSCGQQGPTADCIRKVQKIWLENPTEATALDLQMHDSVILAKRALEATNPSERQPLLIQAIDSARNCFERWGLITESLGQHIQKLYKQGALAVKPTGSGGGGYVLSLWDSSQP